MKKLSLFITVLTFAFSIVTLASTSRAQALSGNEFQAGRIMDDGVFFNSNAYNPDSIQAFLNSKVPTCDTNGTQPYAGTTRAAYAASKGYPAPFTCLKDYVQDTTTLPAEAGLCNGFSSGRKSAAQIIHEVGVSCGVNPRIILILLQKEQSLVTDDWPWSKQYTAATGYFCPDTAPCNPEYAGFFKQVYYGVRQFKRYAQTPDSWGYRSGRNNYIQYNPNAGCNGTNVFIQNQATAGLYVYTPYQPNAAALSNLYGTGDSCSAYGNRNFWRLYHDWFGSTLGALIRTTTSNALFYTEGQKRFTIPSMEIANQFNLGINDVRYVGDAEMNSIPLASSPFSSSLGQVVKSDSDGDADGGSLYLVSKGVRYPFASIDQFTDFGFSTPSIHYLPLSTIQRLPRNQTNLSNFVQAPDKSVYKIEAGKMRAIFELSKLSQLNPSGNISSLAQFTFSNWTFGQPLVDGNYVIIGPDNGIRIYYGTGYHKVPSMGVLDCWNLGTVKTFRVGLYAVTGGTNGGNLSCFTQRSDNATFIMTKTLRYPIASPAGLPISRPHDTLIDRIAPGTLKTVIKGSGGELSIFENNKRRAILNMTAFSQLGLDSSDITTLPDSAYTPLGYGPRILPMGQVLLEPNGALSVVSSLSGRLQVPTIRQYKDFAYDTVKPLPINASEQQAYASAGNLSHFVKTSAGVYLIDAKVRYLVPSELDAHFGINRAGMALSHPALIEKTLTWTATRFVKSPNSAAIYYMENGVKRPISSWQRVEQLGGANKVIVLSEFRVNSFPLGPVI